jgi:predicted HicB family RNase H-like nuclease
MKRVVDGKTYNTDTATVVGKYEYKDHNENDVDATIYVNKGGAYFILHQWTVGSDRHGDSRSKAYIEAMSREEIHNLLSSGRDNVEVIDDKLLETPPEAHAEADSGATIYLRVPASLKNRADTAAEKANLSTNSWAIRCLENCLSGD